MIILEFSLAIIFICLMISLFASWSVDYLFSKLNSKGKLLKNMLKTLLKNNNEDEWVEKLYNHPLIKSLSYKENRLTSYIPANIFADVILDLIKTNSSSKENASIKDRETYLNEVISGIETLPHGELKNMLNLFLSKSLGDIEKLSSSLETWYNEYIVRVNHTYKRLIKMPLFIVGFGAAIIFNIDMIETSKKLWIDAPLRNNVALLAEEFNNNQDSLANLNPDEALFKKYKEEMALPIGWKYERKNRELISQNDAEFSYFKYILLKLSGFIITGLIASFGAPFWYDALQKIIGLKNQLNTKK